MELLIALSFSVNCVIGFHDGGSQRFLQLCLREIRLQLVQNTPDRLKCKPARGIASQMPPIPSAIMPRV